ncbi:glycosyltransferase [Candidatus Woesearchaeota archaeon]|jgi:glycosyltransferase involved in cell wall biosynthesis|nr:glycosyltransferase [Candidatus Woesearchaeota archaeon]
MESNIAIATPQTVLPDVSLAAIVRDEMMNPAGGIIDFIESTVPFVEEAVIVDTGSKDGTRETLEELEARYPNLTVLDHPFQGYADARNFSLQQVQTSKAFVLDADERLTKDDFASLKQTMDANPALYYQFDFLNVAESDFPGIGHNPRLFALENTKYMNQNNHAGECLFIDGIRADKWSDDLVYNNSVITGIDIKHFYTQDFKSFVTKIYSWYQVVVKNGISDIVAPSETQDFELWKAYNPRREEFR